MKANRVESAETPSAETGIRRLKTVASTTSNDAFDRLYQRFFHKLVDGLRATYGSGPPDPEDIAQTAFEKLGQRKNLDDIRDPEGFVWIAARNAMLSEKRRQAVRSNHAEELERRYFSDGCDNFDPERVFSSQQQIALVAEALNDMPERRRRLFMLNRVHGLTPAQAGARCGVSRSSAVRHIAIATEILASALRNADSLPAEEREE